MIAVIRISGMVDVNADIQETLNRINLRRKYALVILPETSDNLKLLRKVRDFVAYGTISDEVLLQLIDKRASPLKGSVSSEKVAEEIKKKPRASWSIKPFFRLHPPRGGIDSKKHFGVSSKAVLGNNGEKINDLIRRML